MSENGFQINTDVSVKPVKKKRKSKKKVAIRAAFIGTAVLLVFAIAFVIFGFTAPVSSVDYIDKIVCEEYNGGDGYITTYFFDKSGKMIKQTQNQKNDSAEIWLYTYKYKGDKLVKEERFCWGSPDSYINYTYEKDLLIRKEIFSSTENVLMAKEEYYYNSDKTLSFKVSFDNEGPVSEHVYTYKDGKLEKETRTSLKDKNVTDTVYEYKGKNIAKKTVIFNVNKENSTTGITEYVYDGKGNRIRQLDDDGNYKLYKYSYSSKKVPLFGNNEINQNIKYEDL